MLRVLWATGRTCSKEWEIDWIRELLDGIEFTIEDIGDDYTKTVPNALIVINHDVPYIQYLFEYEKNNVPFGVIHLSDEWLNDDTRFYELNMCKFVYRNYYFEHRITPKTRFLALGYKRGFWDAAEGEKAIARDRTIAERENVWSFAGAPRIQARRDIIELFKSIEPHHLHIINEGCGFGGSSECLSTDDYRRMMLNSKFSLCPIGIGNTRGHETFRVSESMECGAIPIVIAGSDEKGVSYWESLYGGEAPPFVVCNTWEECITQVNQILKNMQLCEIIRQQTYQFWQDYKLRIKEDIHKDIQEHLLSGAALHPGAPEC